MRLIAILLLLSNAAIATPDGLSLFQEHCAACHGDDAGGGNSPDIRGSSANDVARAIQGFEEMPVIALTDAEIDAIGAWLAALD